MLDCFVRSKINHTYHIRVCVCVFVLCGMWTVQLFSRHTFGWETKQTWKEEKQLHSLFFVPKQWARKIVSRRARRDRCLLSSPSRDTLHCSKQNAWKIYCVAAKKINETSQSIVNLRTSIACSQIQRNLKKRVSQFHFCCIRNTYLAIVII